MYKLLKQEHCDEEK